MQFMEPIHDNWSLDIEPDGNGVSFDAKFGNVVDTQPTCNPCVNAIKFAASKEKKERISFNFMSCKMETDKLAVYLQSN